MPPAKAEFVEREDFDLIKNNLIRIFEEENVITDPDLLLTYYTDASQITGKAGYVVFPKDIEQLRRLIIMAARQDIVLVARGAGTGLAGGAVPDNSVVVDFSRMTRLIDFDSDKKHITVEPGVVLERLNSYLRHFGLFFPVVPSSHRACTIGGMAATDALGIRAIKYGRMSDKIIEAELLDGQGKKHVVRDSSIFGSEGIYGFITKIKLQLEDIPENRSLSVFNFDELSELLDVLPEFEERTNVSALEFLDRQCSSLAGLEEKYHLVVEFDDLSGDIKDEDDIEDVWKARDGLRKVFGEKGLGMIEDPMVPEESLKEFIGWAEMNEVPCFGHIGLGVLHLYFSHEQKGLVENMLKLVKRLGGKVSGKHGIGLQKKRYLDKDSRSRFASLKKRYDPEDIMNRGKITGSWKNKREE